MIVVFLLLHPNFFGYEMVHEIPVISVCVNQYGEERYEDIYKCKCQNLSTLQDLLCPT